MHRVFILNDVILNTNFAPRIEKLLACGAWEMPADQVKQVFGDKANLADNSNTTFQSDGKGGYTNFVFTPPVKTPEQILQEAKAERNQAVNNIVVEVDGMIFDGNEDAQRRISVAITTANITGQQSVDWVLKNNTVATVTREQLEKVLALSMQEMQRLWTLPYTE